MNPCVKQQDPWVPIVTWNRQEQRGWDYAEIRVFASKHLTPDGIMLAMVLVHLKDNTD